MNYEKIIVAIIATFSTVTMFDWFTFIIKKAPASMYFSKLTIKLGFIATAALVYWIINGFRFY